MSNNIKKIIFPIIVAVSLLVLMVFLVIYNEQNKNTLFELRKEINTQNSLPDYREIEKKINSLLEKRGELEPFLFDKDEPLEFIEVVESLAKNNNLDVFVNNARFIDDQKAGNSNLEIIASLEGDILNIREFIHSVESTDKKIKLNRFRILKNQSGDQIYWRADLTLLGKTK